MIRRVHVTNLHPGEIALSAAEAHHVRDVLRLEAGASLQLFNDTGQTADAVIKLVSSWNVVVTVDAVHQPMPGNRVRLTVASAIPKGDRADWMVEKLAELGVDRFIPLAAQRSVVLPAGRNKIERWERTAVESAKQSRRSGVMGIGSLTSLVDLLKSIGPGWFFSTDTDAISVRQAITKMGAELTLLIGPEGGWTDEEIAAMKAAGLHAVGLTSSILRVETAAVVGAGLVMCHTEIHSPPSTG